jgi:hypothetical protein
MSAIEMPKLSDLQSIPEEIGLSFIVSKPCRKRLKEGRKMGKFSRRATPRPLEDAKLKPHWRLNAVRLMTIENPEFAMNIETWPLYLKLLLMCGIHMHAQSMIAPTTFHILEKILSGNEEYGIERAEKCRLVDKSVGDFILTVDVTRQRVTAFPVFWNQRYEQIRPAQVEPMMSLEYHEPTGANNSQNAPETWTSTQSPGLTPLELYERFLLDDPPMFTERQDNEVAGRAERRV